jgi:hypothetical protein
VRHTTFNNLVASLYGASGAFTCFPNVDAPRDDLATIFLTGIPELNQPANVQPAEMLRLNTGVAPNPSATRTAWVCSRVRRTASRTGAG